MCEEKLIDICRRLRLFSLSVGATTIFIAEGLAKIVLSVG